MNNIDSFFVYIASELDLDLEDYAKICQQAKRYYQGLIIPLLKSEVKPKEIMHLLKRYLDEKVGELRDIGAVKK